MSAFEGPTTTPSTTTPRLDRWERSNLTLAAALRRAAGLARREWQWRYVASLLAADAAVGAAAASAALLLRFGPAAFDGRHRGYLFATAALPFAWALTVALNRGYDTRYLFVGNDEYQRVFQSGLALTAAIAFLSFAFDYRFARGYLVIAMPLTVTACVATRYRLRHRLHGGWIRGERLSRVLLVGHPHRVGEMTRLLSRRRYHGMAVVGACVPTGTGGHGALTVPVWPGLDQVATAVRMASADSVLVLACPELDGPALRRLAWQLESDDVDLIVSSSLVDVAGDRTTIRPVDGLPLLHVEHPRLRGTSRVVKDVFDAVLGLLVLVLAAVPLLTIALLVRWEPGARGPALFRQARVGRHGRTFPIYKFRTMYVDAEARLAALRARNEQDGVLFKIRNDPRITRTGRWLRRWSLDELPQVFNVLRGHMSLVGPRPPLPAEVARYPEDMLRRLVVKPGMTGLWQVSGRADLTWEETIRLDLRYVENWSLTMDLVILARTVTAVVRRSGAY